MKTLGRAVLLLVTVLTTLHSDETESGTFSSDGSSRRHGVNHAPASVLVEAEGFSERGGWVVDPQFMEIMGSPYLLAHGLGKPVANAKTTVEFPATGTYYLWVRTMDWVPAHHPGRFHVLTDGVRVGEFGASGRGWHWQDGGRIEIQKRKTSVELEDSTGFDGRCDALFFTPDRDVKPPESADEEMLAWRRRLLKIPATPPPGGSFDLVVVGGGIAGCSAAVTAARLGLDVALVQNRPVLGGNASREIGILPRGLSGPVVEELTSSEERARTVRAEERIELLLGWHATGVIKKGNRILSVDARSIHSGRELRFASRFFVDATGDGSIGYLAGAKYRTGREARSEFNEQLAPEEADELIHGHTVVFRTRTVAAETSFPEVPWATEVSRDHSRIRTRDGLEHQWEYGQHLDPIRDAERIRDHLFRAIYGTYATARRKDPERNRHLELAWVGHIAARGESRRLLGDHILTENDIRSRELFPDRVALGSLFFCMHSPSEDYDFRSDFKLIPVKPYWIPFRCLYSRNIENLLMAGRDISATHVAYTSIKLMKTGGQLGRAVGAAAYLARKYGTNPRGVYRSHIAELQDIVLARGDYRNALKRPESQ